MTDSIYLDHNSTTPIDASVVGVIADCFAENFANPASQHQPGQRARHKLESLRLRIATLLGGQVSGMETDQVVLTSGGTESNNLALMGLSGVRSDCRRVIISAIEHPSVVGAATQLARNGFVVDTIPVDGQGVCRLDALEKMLESPANLVSMMLANNETGAVQPVAQAADICRQHNVLIHTDAIQAVGKIPVNFQQLNVDAMSFSAHKFSGPRGSGGLMVRSGVSPVPILFGGFQQMAIRPGTEEIPMVAGLVQALELYVADPLGRARYLAGMRDRLQSALTSRFDHVVVNSGKTERVPHTLNLSFPGIDRQSFLMAADIAGLAISTGSACASGSSERSPVLLAMGVEKEIVDGAIRISLGISTTESDIDESIRRFNEVVLALSARKSHSQH